MNEIESAVEGISNRQDVRASLRTGWNAARPGPRLRLGMKRGGGSVALDGGRIGCEGVLRALSRPRATC